LDCNAHESPLAPVNLSFMTRQTITVWHLEITDPAAYQRSPKPLSLSLERVSHPEPKFARYLYSSVGGPYGWADRLIWTAAEWTARYADPEVELWVANDGHDPAGYFELERLVGDTVEIAYFGLLPRAVGKGHGGPLLSAAVERAWAMGARRVALHTCSLDHPSALPNYEARGFKVFRTDSR
jgi:GNAT superfamily N-acetyltransferase